MTLVNTIDRWILTFTNITDANGTAASSTLNGVAAGADPSIHVAGAKSIYVQTDALTDTNHTATDFDVNIITSGNGGTTFDDGTSSIYDTKHYDAVDLVGSFLVDTGPTHIKIRVDENGALRADLRINVIVTWGS